MPSEPTSRTDQSNQKRGGDAPPAMAAGEAIVAATVPIDEVTVLEDRARVRRSATVRLDTGQQWLAVRGVAPVLSDKTLTARLLDAEGGARVVDAQVKREATVRPDADEPAEDSSLEQLERRLELLDERIAALAAEQTQIEQSITAIDELGALTLAELSEDVSYGKPLSDGWQRDLDAAHARAHALIARSVEVSRQLGDAHVNRRLLARRIAALRNPAHQLRAELMVELLVERAGRYRLQVEYLVPNACWRPQHTARLHDGPKPRVELRTAAVVWQNTGEDWPAVALTLSTERPSLGTEPPELGVDLLHVQRKSEVLRVQTREQQVEDTGLGAERTAGDELPGIDDGGEPQALHAMAPASVPSDGHPHRVALSSFESDVERELVCMPELSPCVLWRTRQTNRGERPLLAGPVDLIRNSGLCGRTSLLYVAPGERFELGWGPEAELRAKRTEESSDDDRAMLGAWIKRKRKIEIRLSNLGAAPRAVAVRERLPVSEIDKVKIAFDARHSTPGDGPDADGFIDWQVDLEPFGQATVELRYTLDKHQDVVGI